MTDLIKPKEEEAEYTDPWAQRLSAFRSLTGPMASLLLVGFLGWRMIGVLEVVLVEVLRPGVVALEDMRDTYSPDAAKKRR